MGRTHASLAHSLLARGHLQGVGGGDDGDADGVDGCDDDEPLPQGFPDLDVPART